VVPGTLVVYDDWMDYSCAPRITDSVADGQLAVDEDDVSPAAKRAMAEARAQNKFGVLKATGEPKAHWEIAQRFKVTFACVAGSCAPLVNTSGCDANSPFGAIFVVVSIGEAADDGVSWTEEQLSAWRQRNAGCQWVGQNKFVVESTPEFRAKQRRSRNKLRHKRQLPAPKSKSFLDIFG
jgi:hypothetical protein